MPKDLPPGSASLRYPQGDLAILSAEVYDGGPSMASATRRMAATRRPPARGSDDGPRKRPRTQAADDPEPDDKKRTRGRPRLDTQDETAADRRRAQIRLAQRAYRNRKDTAIQTLEKKVQQLKDTNEEMSNAFMQLHDFALGSGLLDRIPDFGRQLRETTEKFLSLAREASDEEKDAEPKASTTTSTGPSSGPSNDRGRSHSPTSASITAETTSPEPDHAEARPEPLLLGGLTATHEPADDGDDGPAISLDLEEMEAMIHKPWTENGFVAYVGLAE